MESMQKALCRLCADVKDSAELWNLEYDEKKYHEVIDKLKLVNASNILDFSTYHRLAKVICLKCDESLSQIQQFVNNIHKAQGILANMSSTSIEDQNNMLSKEKPTFHELKPKHIKTEANEAREVKIEVEAEYSTEQIMYENLTDMQKRINYKTMDAEFDTSQSNENNTREPIVQLEEELDFPILKKLIQMPLKERVAKKKAAKTKSKLTQSQKEARKRARRHSWGCSVCEGKFPTLEKLQIHEKNEHGIDPPKKRRKRNSPVTEDELTCKICNRKYKNLQCIWAHNYREHGKEAQRREKYTCDKCGKTYNKKGSLKSHLQKHIKEKSHICRICDAAFIFPNQLRHHLISHSGVKPFACTQCSRRFSLQRQLLRHQIVHTDIKPFVCKYCGNAFRTKTAMTNHASIHTGMRAYACEYCGMAFSCWGNCSKHMKRIHNATMAKTKRTAHGVLPLDPTTGEIKTTNVEALEEWKTQILLTPLPPPPGAESEQGEQ